MLINFSSTASLISARIKILEHKMKQRYPDKWYGDWWSHLCPTFVPKSGYFLLIWVKVCLKKLTFFFYFWTNFTSWLFWQHVGSFKQEIHLCPCSGVFGCRFFTILPTCYLKGLFFTNKTRDQGTLNCRNYYIYCQITLIYRGNGFLGQQNTVLREIKNF